MASVTKVLATTTAVAQFYQRGEISLGMDLEFFKILIDRFTNFKSVS